MSYPVVLVTMGGRGLRFKNAGYNQPKPFVSVLNQPMIKQVMKMFPEEWPVVFVLNDQDYNQDHIHYLKKIRPKSQIQFVEVNASGPLSTVQKGLSVIEKNQPVFVTYCDYAHIWQPEDFLNEIKKNQSDFAIVAYKGFHPHYLGPNMYCYLKTENNLIVDIKEKESFSSNREEDFASTGGYYFKSADFLQQALEQQVLQSLNWNGEFFTSLAIKAIMNLNQKKTLKGHVYEVKKFFQWGTPEDLKAFEYWSEINYEKFRN